MNVNFIGIRQERNVIGFERLCDFFNKLDIKLHDKILRFSIKKGEK